MANIIDGFINNSETIISIFASFVVSLFFYYRSESKNKISHFFLNDHSSYMLRAFPNYKHSLYNINKGGKRFRILMGGFVNIGKDIEKDDIIFGMKLPEGSSIIEGVKIKTSDNNFKVSSTFNNNLQFKIESSFLKRDFLSML